MTCSSRILIQKCQESRFGAVHKRRHQLVGGGGSKIGQNCRRKELKNCRHRGGFFSFFSTVGFPSKSCTECSNQLTERSRLRQICSIFIQSSDFAQWFCHHLRLFDSPSILTTVNFGLISRQIFSFIKKSANVKSFWY